jgi:protein-disulfide isomerase
MIFRILTVLALLAGTFTARADTPSAFTPEQRAEIVAVVRAALKSDPSILRDAVTALQKDESQQHEAAARTLIGAQAATLTRTPGDAFAGNPNGDVTVVEFTDVRCPYCRRMLPVLSDLLRRDPNVKLIYKEIPILGPASVLGTRAVMAAQRQNGYQKMHDAVMSGPPDITQDTLRVAATQAGLDWEQLRHDMTDPAIQSRIDANLALAHTLGIDGTPAYIVGKRMLAGAVDVAELQGAVNAARQP